MSIMQNMGLLKTNKWKWFLGLFIVLDTVHFYKYPIFPFILM